MDPVAHHRLGQHQRDVARSQRFRERVGIVELRDPHATGHALRQAALQGVLWAGIAVHEALLEVAVVVALEQDHDFAIGDGARETDGLGVGLRGREGELPVGLVRVAPRELLGNHDRVLRRQEELRRAARRARAPRERSRALAWPQNIARSLALKST